MQNWWKTTTSAVINPDLVRVLYTEQSGSDWVIKADLNASDTDVQLAGTYTSQAEALTAVDRLVRPFDVSTLVP